MQLGERLLWLGAGAAALCLLTTRAAVEPAGLGSVVLVLAVAAAVVTDFAADAVASTDAIKGVLNARPKQPWCHAAARALPV